MGSGDSAIYNTLGQQGKSRKCIVMVTPPSYEISKLISRLPADFGYEYVSVGQMIRDQINKKTNYSKIILENLESNKKINVKILDILLKNAVLMGNFIIRFAPRDEQELDVWKSFSGKVKIELGIIIRVEMEETITKRPTYKLRLDDYEREAKQITSLLGKNNVLEIEKEETAVELILKRLQQQHK